MDLKFLVKYPFSKEAKEYLDSLNLTIYDIRKHPIYSASIDLGEKRVNDALNGKINPDMDDETSMQLSLLSYPIARILVNLTGSRDLMRKYATAEAEQAYKFLTSKTKKPETQANVKRIMDEMDLGIEGGKIHFLKYLKLISILSQYKPEWKLVNRQVDSGYVELKKGDDLILLREAIRLKIMEPIDVRRIPGDFKEIAKRLNSTITGFSSVKIEQIDENFLPPCILGMLKSLEMGSVSHNSMFILATFFINLGLNTEDICKIFSVFPRYDENKTRYQMEFLSGERSGVRYSCPGCPKIKSYGLCVRDCGVKHPLKYYRDRYKTRTRKNK